jgi:hypothetical protein
VRRAAKGMRVDYPIAIDNDFAIWNALANKYWPALYFVDAQGRIRHHQFGEGEYEESEQVIQQLLSEAGAGRIGQGLVSIDARGLEAAADWDDLKSQENYVGYARTENFASPGGAARVKPRVYAVPARLKLNALAGDWTVRWAHGAEQAQRTYRVPVPCARSSPRDGTGSEWDPVHSRAHRRQAAERFTRNRRRRAG